MKVQQSMKAECSTTLLTHLMLNSKPYSLFQKKRTFNHDFFCGLPGGGGPKIHMVDYVNGSSTHAQFFSLKNLQPFWRYFYVHQSWAMLRLQFWSALYPKWNATLTFPFFKGLLVFWPWLRVTSCSHLHNRQCEFLTPLPKGGPEKIWN